MEVVRPRFERGALSFDWFYRVAFHGRGDRKMKCIPALRFSRTVCSLFVYPLLRIFFSIKATTFFTEPKLSVVTSSSSTVIVNRS
jgi:hypothetical protein